MPGFDSILTSLSSGLSQLAAGQDVTGTFHKAKATWSAQSPMTQGAIAGGLLGLLLSGNARRMAGTVAEVGAAALIGSLAMKAYSDWQTASATSAPHADDLPHRLLQAMIAAAKADDVITAQERAAMQARLADLGLGAEAEALIRAELDTPLSAEEVATLARSPQEAAALYTASLLVVDQRGQAEQAYLSRLAQALGLDPGLIRHLQENVPAQA